MKKLDVLDNGYLTEQQLVKDIDDSAKNIKVARSLGINGIVYKDYELFLKEINRQFKENDPKKCGLILKQID